MPEPALQIEQLEVDFPTKDGVVHAVRGIDLSLCARRGPGHRRRVGLGQVGDRPGHHGAAAQGRRGARLHPLPRARSSWA